jgi:hypothetical protein
MVQARGTPLKQGCHDHDLKLSRHLAQNLGRRPRNRLGQPEILMVLNLAKVHRGEQLLQTDNLSALSRSLPNLLNRLLKILLRAQPARHLRRRNSHFSSPFHKMLRPSVLGEGRENDQPNVTSTE